MLSADLYGIPCGISPFWQFAGHMMEIACAKTSGFVKFQGYLLLVARGLSLEPSELSFVSGFGLFLVCFDDRVVFAL